MSMPLNFNCLFTKAPFNVNFNCWIRKSPFNELTQSVNIGRSENVRQRRHQDPAPILQFLGLASSQSGQLLLLSSHPGDYAVDADAIH